MSARVFESSDSAARISASLITASCNSSSCVANVSHAAGQCANVVIRLRRMTASDGQRGGTDTGTIYHSLQRASMSRGTSAYSCSLVSLAIGGLATRDIKGRDSGIGCLAKTVCGHLPRHAAAFFPHLPASILHSKLGSAQVSYPASQTPACVCARVS